MALKDLVFTYEGELEITDGVVLMNPEFKPRSGRFDIQTGQGFLLIEFNEAGGIYKHGIEYPFMVPPNGMTNGDLSLVISQHPVLQLFTANQ